MDEIEQAAEFRHDVIHGFVINQVEGTGEAEMFRLIYGAVTPSNRKTYRLTTIEILKAAVRANKIGKRSLQMATGLQDLVASVTAST